MVQLLKVKVASARTQVFLLLNCLQVARALLAVPVMRAEDLPSHALSVFY